MGSMNFVNSAIEKKLMDLHCGYIGKVIWTDGVTAKVQPLGLMKACKEKVKPQMGLAARKFGRRCGERSAAQISHHKVPA